MIVGGILIQRRRSGVLAGPGLSPTYSFSFSLLLSRAYIHVGKTYMGVRWEFMVSG